MFLYVSVHGKSCVSKLLFMFSVHGKSCVSKLLFMSERAYNKEAASLISNGPEGHILFWKVFEGGSLEADFPGVSRLTYCSA
jgi:hypothetical protein